MRIVGLAVAAVLSVFTIHDLTIHSDRAGHNEAIQALLAAYRPEAMVIESVKSPDSNHNRMIVFLRKGERCTVFVHPYMKTQEIRKTASCLPAY